MTATASNKGGFGKNNIIVKKDMNDYSNDPYFVKKAEKAIAFLKKNGLPKSMTKKSK